jgi:chitinase
MIRIAVPCLAALLSACATPPEIVGYYAGWKDAVGLDARRLTVINYAFLDICWHGRHGNPSVEREAPCNAPDGAMVLDDPVRDAANLARLAALKRAHPGLKVMASVGGWTRSNRFSDTAADPRARARFSDSAVVLARTHGFDGIDIDWEYPGAIGVPCAPGFTCERPADKRNFVALVRELRAALDAAGAAAGTRYLATIAAGNARAFLFDGDSSAWMVELAALLDWVNLMTYDYHGTWEARAGLLAPLHRDPADPDPANVDATVTLWLQQGIPARSLVLGLPFYGKGWAGCAPGPTGDGLYQACAAPLADPPEATFAFAQLTDEGYLARDAAGAFTRGGRGYTRHWNAAAGVPYLYNPATAVFITYDDERSVREKVEYAVRRGLRGAMYWEVDGDRHGVLADVVSNALPRPGERR